jgi:hypothetical protein
LLWMNELRSWSSRNGSRRAVVTGGCLNGGRIVKADLECG